MAAAHSPEASVPALTAPVAKILEAAALAETLLALAAKWQESAKQAAEWRVAGWAGAPHAYWVAGRPEL